MIIIAMLVIITMSSFYQNVELTPKMIYKLQLLLL